jgi:hypothetical protein
MAGTLGKCAWTGDSNARVILTNQPSFQTMFWWARSNLCDLCCGFAVLWGELGAVLVAAMAWRENERLARVCGFEAAVHRAAGAGGFALTGSLVSIVALWRKLRVEESRMRQQLGTPIRSMRGTWRR